MREVMLILHFIGLAMGLGTSFAFMFLGIASSKMEKTEAGKFMVNSFVLGKMGHIGLTLLVVSGIFLMTPYWATLADRPLLIIKLVLVVVLGALIGMNTASMKKVQKGNIADYGKKMGIVGRFALLTALLIVIVAVYVFQ